MNDDLPAPGSGPLPPSKGSRPPGGPPPPGPGLAPPPPPPPPSKTGAGSPLDLTTVVPAVSHTATQQGSPTVFGADDPRQPDHRLVIPPASKGRGPLIVIGVLICLLLGGVLVVLLQKDPPVDDNASDTTTTITIPADGDVIVPVTDSSVVETTSIETTTAPPTTAAPTTTVFVDPEVAAQESLNARGAADGAAVSTLIDKWVPQVSTKTAGRTLEGTYYNWQLVWQDFQSSLDAHPEALLLQTDAYNYKLSGWWATVMNISFPSAEAANAWCDQQQYLPDHCFAKRLRYGDVRPGDVVYRK